MNTTVQNTAEFRSKFLQNRDRTGRLLVTSYRTGRVYYVEPIGPDRSADWGSFNPSTGNIEHKKGFDKFRGAIDEADSMITKENGFTKIHYSGIGGSFMSVIDMLDSQYPTLTQSIH